MIEKETIIRAFIEHFVLKDKAERSFLQLMHPKKRRKFTGCLNHQWDTVLDMRRLVPVGTSDDNADSIQRLLGFQDEESMYCISDYSAYDDKIMAFKGVFPSIYARGLGTILINITADTLFLDTEPERGPAKRFTGRYRP